MARQRDVLIEIKYVPSPLVDVLRLRVPVSFNVTDIISIYERFHKDKGNFVFGSLLFIYAGKSLSPAQTIGTLLQQFKGPSGGPDQPLKFFATHQSASNQSEGGYLQEEVLLNFETTLTSGKQSILKAYYLEKEIKFIQSYEQHCASIIPNSESQEYRVLMRDRTEPSNYSFFPYMSPEIDSFVRNHQVQLDEYHKHAMRNSLFNLSNLVSNMLSETQEQMAGNDNRARAERMNRVRRLLHPEILIRGAIQLIFMLLFLLNFLRIMDTFKAIGFLLLFFVLRR